MPDKRGLAAVALALAAGATGCLRRELVIRSEPPGATVRLNGTEVGRTPARVPFLHYGVYRVEVLKEGMAPLVIDERVMAPVYARFPLGLFTEFLWPGTIHDRRYLTYRLEPPKMPERDGLLDRARREADALNP